MKVNVMFAPLSMISHVSACMFVWKEEVGGVAAGPSARRDLSLCLPQAVGHLTRVISSMRGSGQKLWPISAVDTDTLRVNTCAHTELVVKR